MSYLRNHWAELSDFWRDRRAGARAFQRTIRRTAHVSPKQTAAKTVKPALLTCHPSSVQPTTDLAQRFQAPTSALRSHGRLPLAVVVPYNHSNAFLQGFAAPSLPQLLHLLTAEVGMACHT